MAGLTSLPLFHDLRGHPVLVLGTGEAATAKRRLVARAGGEPVGTIDEAKARAVRIAFIALEDQAAAQTAADELRRAGMLVNVVDRPELCDFTTPSILERSPLLIAVGSGGASAGLAKHVRLRLEALLPGSLGALAQALSGARAQLRARLPDPAQRRRALDAALAQGGVLDPFDPASPGRVSDWAGSAATSAEPQVETILLASDDPDALTLRQARLLGMADTILHDSAVPEAILARARADAIRRPLSGQLEADHAAEIGGLTLILRRERASDAEGQ